MRQDPVPYNITAHAGGEKLVSVVRLTDGRFQIVVNGQMTSIITGYQHILVNEKMAATLRQVKVAGVEFRPAVVIRCATGDEWMYVELLCRDELTFETVSTVDVSGVRVWHLAAEALFVSPSLRDHLIAAGFDDLRFYAGLSGYAAGEPAP